MVPITSHTFFLFPDFTFCCFCCSPSTHYLQCGVRHPPIFSIYYFALLLLKFFPLSSDAFAWFYGIKCMKRRFVFRLLFLLRKAVSDVMTLTYNIHMHIKGIGCNMESSRGEKRRGEHYFVCCVVSLITVTRQTRKGKQTAYSSFRRTDHPFFCVVTSLFLIPSHNLSISSSILLLLKSIMFHVITSTEVETEAVREERFPLTVVSAVHSLIATSHSSLPFVIITQSAGSQE